MSEDVKLTLDEWVKLGAEERRRLTGIWFSLERWRDSLGVGQTPLHELLDEAAGRFRSEYGSHPLVTAVAFHWPDHGGEACLSVSTKLLPPQRVEELPALYMTFAVRQEPMALQRWHYVQEWRQLLTHLAGWTDEQVDALVAEHDDQLWGADSGWLYHEAPAFHVAHLLVPRGMWEHVPGPEASSVRGTIAAVLRDALSEEAYDWEAARRRVAEVVARAERGEWR